MCRTVSQCEEESFNISHVLCCLISLGNLHLVSHRKHLAVCWTTSCTKRTFETESISQSEKSSFTVVIWSHWWSEQQSQPLYSLRVYLYLHAISPLLSEWTQKVHFKNQYAIPCCSRNFHENSITKATTSFVALNDHPHLFFRKWREY